MIIVKIQGGLGNQLFQYATGKALAIKNKTELKLDTTEYLTNNYRRYYLDNFNITAKIAGPEEIARYKNSFRKIINNFLPFRSKSIITNFNYQFNEQILKLKNNAYLDGYWQNEKYFIEISELIKKSFTLKSPLSPTAADISKRIANNTSVSIHIRRGDYITSPKFSKIYKILSWDYYAKAIEKISTDADDPVFFIFSDDIERVKNNITLPSSNIIVSNNELSESEELFLMSSCQHNIIANSSFGWWGAWLNQNPSKIIVGPKSWFKFCNDDQGIMPEGWIKL